MPSGPRRLFAGLGLITKLTGAGAASGAGCLRTTLFASFSKIVTGFGHTGVCFVGRFIGLVIGRSIVLKFGFGRSGGLVV